MTCSGRSPAQVKDAMVDEHSLHLTEGEGAVRRWGSYTQPAWGAVEGSRRVEGCVA